MKDGKLKSIIYDICGGYINKWNVEYKKDNETDPWYKANGYSFKVYEKGTYRVRVLNGNIQKEGTITIE